MKRNLNGILSGAVSAGLFLIFLFLFRGGLWVSAGVGVVSYVICALLIFRAREVVLVADGVTQEDMGEILAEGAQKLGEIKTAALKIPDPKVREKIDGIVKIASSIFSDIQKDPKNIRQARKFITYYMETTGYIVKRYTEISANKAYLDGGDALLGRISGALDGLYELFTKLKGKLMEDDLMDLDTEIKLLEQTIKSEGI